MKYLYKPRKLSVIIFVALCIVCVLCNLLFLFRHIGILPFNDALLVGLHTVLPLCYLASVLMVFLYVIMCIENLCSCMPLRRYLGAIKILRWVDILLGILLLFSIIELPRLDSISFYEYLAHTIYFQNLPVSESLSTVSSYWSIMPITFVFIAAPIALFCTSYRKLRIKRELEYEAHWIEAKQEIRKDLGVEYEDSEFYKQIQIPYDELCQKDGTRGEFEAYRALIKDGLADAEYIFNREVPKNDGLFTELDLVVVHKNGIVVIENKHYTTRIFGNALDHDLSIIDHAGNKKSIYNPIRQNEKHVLALKEYLHTMGFYIDYREIPVHSIVVFTAEGYDQSDDIISGINTEGITTKVCTSQNVGYIVKQILSENDLNIELNVNEIKKVLSALSIRKKST